MRVWERAPLGNCSGLTGRQTGAGYELYAELGGTVQLMSLTRTGGAWQAVPGSVVFCDKLLPLSDGRTLKVTGGRYEIQS